MEDELTRFPGDALVEIVWQRQDGSLTSRITDDLDPTTPTAPCEHAGPTEPEPRESGMELTAGLLGALLGTSVGALITILTAWLQSRPRLALLVRSRSQDAAHVGL